MRQRGRPADGQHRRMRALLSTLADRGADGATKQQLMVAMGFTPGDASDERKFFRDLRNLQVAGWLIDSHPPRGAADQHRFVLTLVDHRLRATFTAAERAQLLRAARAAGLGQLYRDLDPRVPDATPAPGDFHLELAQWATAWRAPLTFSYSGKPRVVDPYDVARKADGWLLRGREVDTDTVKNFYLNRVSDVDVGKPGTAESVPTDLPPINNDPMLFEIHAPVEVEVESPSEAWGDVVAALGARGHRPGSAAGDGMVRTVVEVSFMDAFVDRVLELGTRVRVLGPDEARDALRYRLLAVLASARGSGSDQTQAHRTTGAAA